MPKHHLLIEKFLDKTISAEERRVLEKWILEDEKNKAFFEDYITRSNKGSQLNFDSDAGYERFLVSVNKRRSKRKMIYGLFKYAAALAILLTIGILLKNSMDGNNAPDIHEIVSEDQKDIQNPNDIVITLADGTTKVISPEGKEAVKDIHGNIVASKEEDALVFEDDNRSGSDEVRYNEVYIPYGQTFKLKLSDGTLVWLNAGSKLRFPLRFLGGSSRTVHLEGEAFFDVVKNENSPFIVNAQEVAIEVLGTQFNVSSYDTDRSIATTLVEGSVSVYGIETPGEALKLTPSFQANFDRASHQLSADLVDTEIYTGWMQHKIILDGLKFSEILVRLERTYQVTFINKAKHLEDEIFTGEFENETIESILDIIALSTPFKYSKHQNTITIME